MDNYSHNMDKELDKALEKEKHSVFGFFIKNYRVTYLLTIAIVILGFYSLFTLPREAEPEVEVPFATISTIYPGASPVDVEGLVTDKIEQKIKNLDNLKKYNSTSRLGMSNISVEFDAGADLKESFRKLREAVDDAKSDLPEEAKTPVVTELRLSDMPIVTYSLVGDYSDQELKKYADYLKDQLKSIKGVSKVKIIGGITREFQVIVDQTKLVNYHLSLSQVVAAISNNNFNLPSGSIEINNYKYNVRIEGKIDQAYDLDNIVIATYNNSPVFLSDIALVKDTYKEKTSESRIGFADQKSQNAISLQVYKKTGGNILDIVDESQNIINLSKKSNNIPKNLRLEKTNDNSVYIRDDINTLGSSAIQTFILISLILLLILSLRGAIITALSVPISFLMAFFFLKTQGMTLNSMVLFSLVLSLGLMVDNSIIIIEGINEYVEKYKKSIFDAALLSVWNFKRPIITGTLTTVAAFVPMLLVSGMIGKYMSIIPKTISVTLLSSLFVSLIIIPTLTYRLVKVKNKEKHNRTKKRHVFIAKLMAKFHQAYYSGLKPILVNKKKRLAVIIISWALFILAALIPASGLMKIEMFPKIDFGYFFINVELPAGSNLKKTDQVAEKVESVIEKIPELKNYVINLGISAPDSRGRGGEMGLNKASITVNLVDKDLRKRNSSDIAKSVRKEIEDIQGAKINVVEMSAGPSTGSPLEVRIFSKQLDKSSKVASQVTNILQNIKGTINVNNNLDNSTGEFTFSLNKQKLNYYGLSVMSVASTIRSAIYGTTTSTINVAGDDIDVIVKYDKDKLTNVNDLASILLFTPQGKNIQLKQVAKLQLEPSLLAINHKEGKKVAIVSSDLKTDANLQTVLAEVNDKISNLQLPAGVSIKVGGENDDIQQSFSDLFGAMIIAILLILFILVLQFNSFKQPLIILISFPLSIIGVILGLNILKLPFSISVFIGIVSLAGIVVNDAIVLIDKINKNIKNGMEFFEAIMNGGISRMQPILLTSITTIAGVIPLIYANELWRGLSLTIIFGLIFSTIANLTITPILYAAMCHKKYDRGKRDSINNYLQENK